MNVKAIIGSIFLGLTLPTFAFANVPTPSSLSSLNQEQFNTLGTIKIAQRYLNPEYVSSRLYSSQSQIIATAYDYSQGEKVRWDSISVEQINNQQIKLNVHGKITIRKKPPIRVGLYLQRNSQGDFVFTDYDWSTGKRCRFACDKRVKEALRDLPSHFPRFQEVLNRILA